MILNEIKCHVTTSLGVVGESIPYIPPDSSSGAEDDLTRTSSQAHWTMATQDTWQKQRLN